NVPYVTPLTHSFRSPTYRNLPGAEGRAADHKSFVCFMSSRAALKVPQIRTGVSAGRARGLGRRRAPGALGRGQLLDDLHHRAGVQVAEAGGQPGLLVALGHVGEADGNVQLAGAGGEWGGGLFSA